MTEAYPLQWPVGMPRTERPIASRFQTSLTKALSNVKKELRLFGENSEKKVTNLVISSNFTLGDTRPRDPAVAAYFQWDGLGCCIAVDRYPKIEDNLQAIAKVIEAERAKIRHGGLNIVRAAFRGYASLPPPSDDRQPWWEVLGVERGASLAAVTNAYRRIAKRHHPDNGGSAERMAMLNQAYEEAKATIAASASGATA